MSILDGVAVFSALEVEQVAGDRFIKLKSKCSQFVDSFFLWWSAKV